MVRSFAVTSMCGLLLAGCSPYVYKDEIANFSTGVTALNAGYKTGGAAYDAAVAKQREAGWIASRSRLHLLSGCLSLNRTASVCEIVPTDVSKSLPPTDEQTKIAKAAPSFAALKTYADALAAVTNAADNATLTQATQSLTKAVSGFGGEVAKLYPPAAAASAIAIATQATSLIGLGITTYLDYRRYLALRENVPKADAALQVVGQTIEAALVTIRATQLEPIKDDLADTQNTFRDSAVGKLSRTAYQAQFTGWQANVTAFNQARASDPGATIAALLTAHKKLADALSNGSGQLQSVLTAAQSFATDAGKLQTAVDSATAAKKP